METAIISENISSIDFSMLSLFLKADFVVKSVIIILVIASVWSWKIIIEKLITINFRGFIINKNKNLGDALVAQ